ncbi:MAG: (Fe-S)-binding protein [Dehalococcoidia bacterium]
MKKESEIRTISQNPGEKLLNITVKDLMPLPCSEATSKETQMITGEQNNHYDYSLDGVSALALSRPRDKEEGKRLVQSFLNGLKKLLSDQDNWTFSQPLALSLEFCARCQTCSEVCPIYLSSGKQEIYRPIFRSELLRRIKRKYLDFGGNFISKFTGDSIELNWTTIARLAELAYRCTLCGKCAQVCPMGIDNGLITREIRKLFSQELGIAPVEFHRLGTVRQLEIGSSTGITPKAFKNTVEFMEDEIEEKIGRRIHIPVDREGADILLIHNAGEFLAWPENPEAFAVILDSVGASWTLSSELIGYDAVNYGAWYDDIQMAKIVMKHAQLAKYLGVKKILIGECGHAQKVLVSLGDRILPSDLNIPRINCLSFFENIISRNQLKFNPEKNNFLVTLHDPCSVVRLSGIVEPQRNILKRVCPEFREMEPHGVNNYCCGGGSGFAIIKSQGFSDWRINVAGRMKIKQIMQTFEDTNPEIRKYVCAPCSNCKSQLRDLLSYYNIGEKYNISYTGIAELIVNAMVETKVPWLPVQK